MALTEDTEYTDDRIVGLLQTVYNTPDKIGIGFDRILRDIVSDYLVADAPMVKVSRLLRDDPLEVGCVILLSLYQLTFAVVNRADRNFATFVDLEDNPDARLGVTIDLPMQAGERMGESTLCYPAKSLSLAALGAFLILLGVMATIKHTDYLRTVN